MKKIFLWGILLILSFTSVSASAQMTTARMVGTVTDPSGATVPEAHIQVTNHATGVTREVVTNGQGLFVIVSLQPATYDVKATAPGFAAYQAHGIVLTVGQELTRDIQLPVEGSSTDVNVDAGAINTLDTSSARIGANIPNREIQNLPINGRQISQLYLLVPGATNAGTGTFDNIHFSGRSVQQNIIRLDGIEATSIIDSSPGNLNGELTSTFRLQQSMEAIQEFRVDSSNYPAEMGTGTGGQISFVTKSGTNNYHGSVFEYLRNDFFDARNTFNSVNTANNLTKFRLNQFGGSIGGPVLKDKVFFFANYEGLRQIWAAPYTQGTLSNCSRARITSTSAVSPLLAAFPNDPNALSSESPVYNLSGQVTGCGVASLNATSVGTNKINEDYGLARLDYHLNDRFQLYARYSRDQGNSTQIQDASLSQFGQVAVPQNAMVALNQVWSNSIFNETKFGFNGIKERVLGISGTSPNADLSRARIAVAGLTNIGSLISLSSSFNGVGAPYTGQSYSAIDNFSVVRGSHNMKFGVEIRPIGLYNNQLGGTTYTYNSIDNFISNSPAQIQFYGDLSDLSPFTGLSGQAHVKQDYYIGYAQDEWKIRPNVTLAYGLRYEYFSPLHEDRNKVVVFSMSEGTIYPGYKGDWYKSSTANWGPRFGLTWSPTRSNNRMVVRVGAGTYFGPGQTEDQIQPEANDRVTRTFTSGKVYPIDPATDVYQGYDINSPTLGYQPRAYAPNYKVPERVTTYTASVQQELPGNFQFMIGYVGSQGRNLFQRSITNLITGVTQNATTGVGTAVREFGNRFAEIDYKTSGGSDHYHSLQTTLQRRFTDGLSLGAQYTFAKELGTSSGSNEANTSQEPLQYAGGRAAEYGRGNFDIRHSMNVTALYELPFGKGKAHALSGAMDAVAGGWQIGSIVNFRSGVPIDVLITRPDLAYVGNAGTQYAGQVFSSPVINSGVVQTTAVVNVPGGGNTRNVRRPNVIAGVSPFLGKGRQFLNPAAFTTPAPGTFGNARRNNYSGPVLAQLDLTLAKTFRVYEGFSLKFGADAYNVLNHPNYANPGTVRLAQSIPTGGTGTAASPFTASSSSIQPGTPFSLSSSGNASFGSLTSTVGNQVGIGANRQFQLSLRAIF